MICLKLGSWLASQKADKNVQLHCRSPHGERGLKSHDVNHGTTQLSRSPHGERGLKYGRRIYSLRNYSRSPHGERGLKYKTSWDEKDWRTCRSPHGERGLKL